MPELVSSFCPRCDREYKSESKRTANDLVRHHISIQVDQEHDGALDEWDDMNGR